MCLISSLIAYSPWPLYFTIKWSWYVFRDIRVQEGIKRPMNLLYADHPCTKLWYLTTSRNFWLLWPIKLVARYLVKLQPVGLNWHLWKKKARKRTQILFFFFFYGVSLRLLVCVITGHCVIGCMFERMGYPRNDLLFRWGKARVCATSFMWLYLITGTQNTMSWQTQFSKSRILERRL